MQTTQHIPLSEAFTAFWEAMTKHAISPTATALYFAILQAARTEEYINTGPFFCPNGELIRICNISEPTLIRARQELAENGLIDFEAGKRKSASPKYFLLKSFNLKNLSHDTIVYNNNNNYNTVSTLKNLSKNDDLNLKDLSKEATDTTSTITNLKDTTWYCALTTPDYQRETQKTLYLSEADHEKYVLEYLSQKVFELGGIAKLEATKEKTTRMLADFRAWIPQSAERALTQTFREYLNIEFPNRSIDTAIASADDEAAAKQSNTNRIVNWQAWYRKYVRNQRQDKKTAPASPPIITTNKITI